MWRKVMVKSYWGSANASFALYNSDNIRRCISLLVIPSLLSHITQSYVVMWRLTSNSINPKWQIYPMSGRIGLEQIYYSPLDAHSHLPFHWYWEYHNKYSLNNLFKIPQHHYGVFFVEWKVNILQFISYLPLFLFSTAKWNDNIILVRLIELW